MNISLDLGNVPSVLAALADPKNAQLVSNAAAESFVDDVLEWIAGGKAFVSRTGQLEQSIGWRPDGGGAEIYANADYAGYVEFGTDAHPILPKNGKGVKIPVADGGGYVLRRAVMHPGSKAHPFFFADLPGRQQRMQAKALSVLAAKLANAGR